MYLIIKKKGKDDLVQTLVWDQEEAQIPWGLRQEDP